MRAFASLILCALAASGCSEPAAPTAPATATPPEPAPTPEPVPDPKPAPDAEPERAPEPEPPKALVAPDGSEMRACPEGEGIPEAMSCIPGGPFVRGSNDHWDHAKPQAEVWVQTFWMDQYEVTYAEYKACQKAGECDRAGPQYVDFDRPAQPINGISWFDADKYCRAQGKRLPTEAEWEKAARGGDARLYPWGDEEATCAHAIIKGEPEGRGCGVLKSGKKPDTGYPWNVGSRDPNPYGLYDMAGNAYEWVADWFATSYEACGEACGGVDPKGPCDGAKSCHGYRRKVVRGGSWYWDRTYATGVHRRDHVPKNPIDNFHHFGFRCAASPSEAQALPQDQPAVPDQERAVGESSP